MDKPLIHDVTLATMMAALNSSHHALALVGPYGTGKSYVADWLAQQMMGKSYRPENKRHITPNENTIGIDQIREITSFLKLKTTGDANIRRIVIIEDAHTLTIEAQNALLKSLEDPPEDTRLILTIAGQHALLPTIYSRLHSIHVLPISESDFNTYVGDKFTPTDTKRAYAISGGLAGLGLALLEDKNHELSIAISEAKSLLSKSAYERLLEVDHLAKDKEKAKSLLFALKRVLSAGMTQADGTKLERILQALKSVHRAEADLVRNPNMKLMLTNVMLNL